MFTRATLVLCLIALATAAAAHDIEVGADGKTIGWTSPVPLGRNVTIALSTHEPVDDFQIRYRPVASLTTPELLTERDAIARPQTAGSGVYTIPASPSGFTIYNVWKKTGTAAAPADIAAARAELATLTPRIQELDRTLTASQQQQRLNALVEERDDLQEAAGTNPNAKEIERLTRRITDLERELETYVRIPVSRSVDAVREIQLQLRPLREQKAMLEALDVTNNARIEELDRQIEALKADPALVRMTTALETAKGREEKLNAVIGSFDAYTVLKIGLIVAGPQRKALYYNLAGEPAANLLRLEQVGDVPLLADGDLIYLLVARKRSAPVGAFTLTVTTTVGTTIDSAPVRPTTQIPTGLESAPARFKEDHAYEDVVLPFVRPARGNDIYKITVKTRADVVTEDKVTVATSGRTESKITEKQSVDLLKDVELPQVHPLYRLNVTTGLAYSGIRQPEFEKVQTALDNPETTPTNEARFRTDRREGNREARPLLALTIYWNRHDPLQRLTAKERLTPNPTVGLGFTDPTSNIFLGFSNELWRGVQVVWGLHRGEIEELVNRSEVNEDQQATLPGKRKEPDEKFFVGMTMNLNFLTRLIKLPAAN